ncbi:MAG: Gfo/Idh/MocA family oxidoreductase [Acutalibacteraceae bacterium]|nr:Gfo/Idh/MocA family oxidoreductase [Acutalibacteraceae bacterium]
MLKVGMVGVGNISGIYLKNFKEVFKNVELVAVCDLIKERAEKAQKEYNIPKIYDTMEQLFADDDIDMVLNLTRPYQHFEVSKAALLAGKHVYSEKPLGADFEEGTQLVKLAQEKGLWIGGAPDTFLGAGIQTCRKFIDDGKLGEVIGGRCVMAHHGVESWHPDPDFFYQFGGGPLLDMGPYYITALINLLGEVKSVFGVAQTTFKERLITSEARRGETIKVNVPTHYETLLTFTNGATVSFLTSFDLYGFDHPAIQLYGTKGHLIVPDPNCFANQCGMSFIDGESGEKTDLQFEFGYNENSRCLGLADLAAAIEQGRTPRASYLQTYHVLEVMTGIMKSAETGKVYEMTTHFKREEPMDASLPAGVL